MYALHLLILNEPQNPEICTKAIAEMADCLKYRPHCFLTTGGHYKQSSYIIWVYLKM